tara:strand:- start:2658 stop:2840 length:183 start_codon:yes stop_codon:yes gene_type:complete
MKVGDLVSLNPEFFGGDPPDDTGLILQRLQPHRGQMFLILWNDGQIEPFHEDDLVLASES